MKKFLCFTAGTLWIGLSRAYDIYCTYDFTPDLQREANPLVTVLGIDNWFWLMLIIIPLIIYTIYAWYYRIYLLDLDYPEEKDLSFGDFMAYLYFNKRKKWYEMLYKLPLSLRQNHRIMSMLLPQGLMFAGVVSTIMWIGIRQQWSWYLELHSVPLIWAIIIIGTGAIFVLNCRKEYSVYKSS